MVISDAFPSPLMIPLYIKIKKEKFLKIVEHDSLERQHILTAYLIGYEGISKSLAKIQETYH